VKTGLSLHGSGKPAVQLIGRRAAAGFGFEVPIRACRMNDRNFKSTTLVDIFIRLLAASIVLLLGLVWAGVLDRTGAVPVSSIEAPRGHAYVMPRIELRPGALPNWFYDTDGDSVEAPTASSLRLHEDGRRMDRPHARQSDLEEVGGGFYSHWSGALWFST